MSRETLRNAIEDTEFEVRNGEAGFCLDKEKAERVIAAARAYACERCGGRGTVREPLTDDFPPRFGPVPCPDCFRWRLIADGGEG